MLAKGVLGSHWLLLLTLHHSLGELHQPHSIFRLWENPITHAPLMASPSVSLTAPLPNQAFPWPGWPHHLVVTGCLCHKGSRTLHKTSRTKKPYQQSLNMLKRLVSPVTCQKRVAWLACHLSGWLGFTCHLTPASLQNTACHLALKAWLGFILSQLGMLKRFCCIAFANSIYKFTFFFFSKKIFEEFLDCAFWIFRSFLGFFSTCFEISVWNLVYTCSRWLYTSSSSFIPIGTLWPTLQPKIGQSHLSAFMALKII